MSDVRQLVVASVVLFTAACAGTADDLRETSGTSKAIAAEAVPRPIVVISDLHFGVGKNGDAWSNFEDFRWSNALRGFLEMLPKEYGDGVDLVIAGDLLELWQHPDVPCAGCGNDLGCSVSEVQRIAATVIRAHSDDLRLFGKFADRGSNRVFVIPGNHDAALLLDNIWVNVNSGIGATSGRVFRPESGRWASNDGFVVIEHGHQMDRGVNSFGQWPKITRECPLHRDRPSDDQTEYLERPWGEAFVQKLYNDVEKEFPVIDNLIPESAGAAIYSRRQGFFGSAADAARFIAFNAFQTSLRQKVELSIADPTKADVWDVSAARQRGHRLFADTLAADDPLRQQLVGGSDQRTIELRQSLDELARNKNELTDDAVYALCDQVKIRARHDPMAGRQLCTRDLLLGTARSLLPLSRTLAPYLARLIANGQRNMRVFVYGHTHQADFDITIKPSATKNVSVANTGAFQRLMDLDHFTSRAAAKGMAAEVALGTFTLERDFPACYSTVVVVYDVNGIPKPEVKHWLMDELDTAGELLSACDARCGARPPRCQAR